MGDFLGGETLQRFFFENFLYELGGRFGGGGNMFFYRFKAAYFGEDLGRPFF